MNKIRKRSSFLSLQVAIAAAAVHVAFAVPAAFSQSSEPPVAAWESKGDNEKLRKLEDRLRELQAEIDLLRKDVERLRIAAADRKDEPTEGASTGSDAARAGDRTAGKESFASPPQEKKDLGVDLGNARLIPYGSIYFNAFTNSGGTNNADVPLFANPTGRGGTGASLRQTRLGLRLEGGKAGNARLGGVLEADFFGGFPAVGIGENFGVVRLRLANLRLEWERTSVTFGQDWSVFAPVNPVSLAAAAIPQMAAAGNNWARLPQVKIETKLGSFIRWQSAVAAQQTGDSAANAAFFLQPNSGSASRIPVFESRLSLSDPDLFGKKLSGSFGLSGHYGRSRIFTGAASTRYEIDSVGAAIDWNFQAHRRFAVSGEAFFGRNIAGSQSGIFQGYNTEFALVQGTTLVPAGVRAIGTRGGWIQIGFTPPAAGGRLSLYASFGIDDPRNRDLTTTVPRDLRTRNIALAFDAIYKVTPQLSIGAEFRRFQTAWTLSGRQNSNHTNLAAVYSF